jgi:hypothetical protein
MLYEDDVGLLANKSGATRLSRGQIGQPIHAQIQPG